MQEIHTFRRVGNMLFAVTATLTIVAFGSHLIYFCVIFGSLVGTGCSMRGLPVVLLGMHISPGGRGLPVVLLGMHTSPGERGLPVVLDMTFRQAGGDLN